VSRIIYKESSEARKESEQKVVLRYKMQELTRSNALDKSNLMRTTKYPLCCPSGVSRIF
jgi:hypothetical protein